MTLWIDNGGRVACIDHGGAYLKSGVQHHPRARRIDTPITAWHRVTKADRADGEWVCETCDRKT